MPHVLLLLVLLLLLLRLQWSKQYSDGTAGDCCPRAAAAALLAAENCPLHSGTPSLKTVPRELERALSCLQVKAASDAREQHSLEQDGGQPEAVAARELMHLAKQGDRGSGSSEPSDRDGAAGNNVRC